MINLVLGLVLAVPPSNTLRPFVIEPGVIMPAVNIGHPDSGCTHGLGPGCAAAAGNMTLMWLKIGGVGIDTAYGYQNQPQVGAAINAAIKTKIVANRSSVFVTSKINPEHCTEEAALEAVKVDVQQLNVGYIDLVLQHFPCSTASENQAVWRGLTSAKNQGFVRSVGVSHYTVANLESILSPNIGTPAVNQCSLYLGFHDDETISYCKSKSITYEAYGALRDVDLTGTVITKIASSHQVSTAQVALRWVTQYQGGCPVAVSPGENQQYAEEDLDLGSFTLSEKEMELLSAIKAPGATA